MNIYLLLLLRIVHILAGVGWVGGAVIHTLFLEPSAKATAPDSRRFMQYLMGRGRYSVFMAVTSGLTVLAGGLLFWNSSGGFQWIWIRSGWASRSTRRRGRCRRAAKTLIAALRRSPMRARSRRWRSASACRC